MNDDPTHTLDVRGRHGRFAPGNKGGPGNPHAKKVAQLRSALLDAVSPEDVQAVIVALLEKAKAGDVAAAREVLERTLGKPIELDLIERLDSVEALLEAVQQRRGQMGRN